MKGDTPIKAARKKLGKTQVQVAKEVGVAETVYQQYEYGKVTPNVKIGNRIAKVLKTTQKKLWGYDW